VFAISLGVMVDFYYKKGKISGKMEFVLDRLLGKRTD